MSCSTLLRLVCLGVLTWVLVACGGVSFRVAKDVAAPRSVAVLPLGGKADPGARTLARALLVERLRGRGLQVVAIDFVDRVLAEQGWLTDPERFDPKALPLPKVREVLAVDAVLVGHDLDESRFNILLLRRHAFGGTIGLRNGTESAWWSANHVASLLGGLLLMSGQVISEIRAQIVHGSSMATLGLVDTYVEDVAETVPVQKQVDGSPGSNVSLTEVRAERTAVPTAGLERIVVKANASPGATLTFDLDPRRTAIPMAGRAGVFVGAQDVPVGSVRRVRVAARGPFGGDPVAAEVELR
ncbi:MAG: hypothetical protein KDC87_08750 [Planctomycetes bacterium]|nr:hypothetical protein [Planctomycetota bacterium]MCB9868740.1 hypothetical protein [Planctomycetota bacterium]MCB9888752.1 hypothetical protein [Planctomycetota bacterium]